MKSKMSFATLMIGMLLVTAMVSMQAAIVGRHTIEQSTAQATGTNKRTKKGKVKKATQDVGRGTKDTGKGIAKGGEKVGKGVAKGSKTAANATTDTAKDASKATAKGAKKTGKAASKTAKKIGSVFK